MLSKSAETLHAGILNGVVMSGHLMKRGGLIKTWKSRLFVLLYDRLIYMSVSEKVCVCGLFSR